MEPHTLTASRLSHINGLRAIAILGVFFYHLKASYCPTGYFGVDLFLVLSGFLLFRSMCKPGEAHHFHYGSYLLKKAWRSIPSWFAVALVVCLVSIYLFHSSRMTDILKTARYSSVFVSDFFIDASGDYFNVFSQQNPFLHLWYLSITQQLYILAPLLVIPLSRYCSRRAAIILLGALGLLSFAYYILTTTHGLVPAATQETLLRAVGTKTAYYHLLPRFWEVVAGYGVFLLPAFENRRLLRAVLGLTGLLGILVSFFLYETGSPAVYLTVISSLLTLRYAMGGLAGAILNSKPLQAIGTISFSLYLWHWPIFVFWKYLSFDQPGLWDEVGMVALSLVMGTLCWWAIERIQTPQRTLWRCSLLLLIPTCVGLTLYGHQYLGARNDSEMRGGVPPTILKDPVAETDEALLAGADFLSRYTRGKHPILRMGDPKAKPSFLLMGDSHAAHYYTALNEACQREGIRGVFITAKVMPYGHLEPKSSPEIDTAWNEDIATHLIKYLELHPEITHVIISQYWGYRLAGAGYFPARNWKSGKVITDKDEFLPLAVQGLGNTCDQLRALGRVPVLLGETPCFPDPSPMDEWQRCQKLNLTYRERWVGLAQYEKEAGQSNRVMEKLQTEGRAYYFSPVPALLVGGCFPDRMDGEFLYADKDHLSLTGSARVIASYMPRLLALIRSKQMPGEPTTKDAAETQP